MRKYDEYLIIVSTVVAILISRAADFFWPNFIYHKYIEYQSLNPWIGLILYVLFLIVLSIPIILVVKFLARGILFED